jgi:hypothetical protein
MQELQVKWRDCGPSSSLRESEWEELTPPTNFLARNQMNLGDDKMVRI